MKKYRVRVLLVGDDKISLNEFHVTLAGSEVDITDAVLQGASLDELLERHELEELKGSKPDSDQLEYMKKEHSGKSNSNLINKAKNSHRNDQPNKSKNTPKSNKRTAQNDHSNRKVLREMRNSD